MMDLAAISSIAALGGSLLLVAASLSRAPWKKAALRLGLEFQSRFILATPLLRGQLREFEVEVFPQGKAICIEVHGVDPGFSLGRESAMSRLITSDLETGDSDFDHKIRIAGDADLALAVLGHETRSLVGRLVYYDEDEVSDGKIRKRVVGFEDVRAALDSMLDLAEALQRPEPEQVPWLLSRRALEDSSLGVRQRAFHLLATSGFRGDEARHTARHLRDVADAALRLEARRVLLREPKPEGAEAARSLMRMAQQLSDPSLRIRAINSVASSAFRKEHVSDMADLLRNPSKDLSKNPPDVRRAALAGLVRARALDELLQVELGDDPDEAVELARGLRRIGDSAAQPRLLELLRHSKAQVRVEAAKALGAVGDVHAVGELRNALDSGVLAKLALGRAAEAAIELIKGRLGGTQAGEISIVDPVPLEGAVTTAAEDGEGASNTSRGGEVSLT